MAAVSSLAHVALDVVDVDAWVEFAVSIFGMQPLEKDDGVVELRFDDYHHRITLCPAASNKLRSVGWEVSSAEASANLVEKLHVVGVQTSLADEDLCAERRVAQLVSFTDPNLKITHELLVGPETGHVFVPTRDISGFVTGQLGLGHIMFNAADREETISFFEKALGFKLSDHILWDGKEASFLHCNPRHHSLAIMNEFPPLKNGDLNHIMFEAHSIDDVGHAYDIVRDRGYSVLFEPGKHSNDFMQSFYVFSPSGFPIEYGFGGRLIDEEWQVETHDAPMLYGHRMVGAPH